MTAITDSKSAKADASRETREREPAERRLPKTVVVGRVLRSHGVRGEVKVDIQSDVEERFEVGSELLLKPRRKDGEPKQRPRTVRIEQIRPTRGASIVRFEGCDTREQADELRGARLEVERDKVPPAPEGFWYYYELIGCRCVDQTHGELGKVVDLMEDGGGHLLRVRGFAEDVREDDGGGDDGQKKTGRKEELLIPMVGAFLREVDVEGGIIRLDLPEGLIETCTSKS